jgi:hypothetical protein
LNIAANSNSFELVSGAWNATVHEPYSGTADHTKYVAAEGLDANFNTEASTNTTSTEDILRKRISLPKSIDITCASFLGSGRDEYELNQ